MVHVESCMEMCIYIYMEVRPFPLSPLSPLPLPPLLPSLPPLPFQSIFVTKIANGGLAEQDG